MYVRVCLWVHISYEHSDECGFGLWCHEYNSSNVTRDDTMRNVRWYAAYYNIQICPTFNTSKWWSTVCNRSVISSVQLITWFVVRSMHCNRGGSWIPHSHGTVIFSWGLCSVYIMPYWYEIHWWDTHCVFVLPLGEIVVCVQRIGGACVCRRVFMWTHLLAQHAYSRESRIFHLRRRLFRLEPVRSNVANAP